MPPSIISPCACHRFWSRDSLRESSLNSYFLSFPSRFAHGRLRRVSLSMQHNQNCLSMSNTDAHPHAHGSWLWSLISEWVAADECRLIARLFWVDSFNGCLTNSLPILPGVRLGSMLSVFQIAARSVFNSQIESDLVTKVFLQVPINVNECSVRDVRIELVMPFWVCKGFAHFSVNFTEFSVCNSRFRRECEPQRIEFGSQRFKIARNKALRLRGEPLEIQTWVFVNSIGHMPNSKAL